LPILIDKLGSMLVGTIEYVLVDRLDQWSPTVLRSDPILNENVISVYTRPHFVFW